MCFMKSWRDNISFVLVEPQQTGNIGASARALKNMGFKRLEMVKPPCSWMEEAKTMACGEMDVLGQARVHARIEETLQDKQLIVGTTRRWGKDRGFFLPFQEGIKKISLSAKNNEVAVLFGRESSGLNTREIKACSFLVTIPSFPPPSSLNLSQSVMLVAYELNREKSSGQTPVWIKHKDLAALYKRIRSTLSLLEYDPKGDRDMEESILLNIKKMIGRAGLTEWELNMILGLCHQIEKKIKKPKISA